MIAVIIVLYNNMESCNKLLYSKVVMHAESLYVNHASYSLDIYEFSRHCQSQDICYCACERSLVSECLYRIFYDTTVVEVVSLYNRFVCTGSKPTLLKFLHST